MLGWRDFFTGEETQGTMIPRPAYRFSHAAFLCHGLKEVNKESVREVMALLKDENSELGRWSSHINFAVANGQLRVSTLRGPSGEQMITAESLKKWLSVKHPKVRPEELFGPELPPYDWVKEALEQAQEKILELEMARDIAHKTKDEQPLVSTERQSLLLVIFALRSMIQEKAKTPLKVKAIETKIEALGYKLDNETIRKIFKRIEEFIEPKLSEGSPS